MDQWALGKTQPAEASHCLHRHPEAVQHRPPDQCGPHGGPQVQLALVSGYSSQTSLHAKVEVLSSQGSFYVPLSHPAPPSERIWSV